MKTVSRPLPAHLQNKSKGQLSGPGFGDSDMGLQNYSGYREGGGTILWRIIQYFQSRQLLDR